MSSNDDKWGLQSDLERMSARRMQTEVYEPKTGEHEGYGFIVVALLLTFASGAAFFQGVLGYEAGLSLLILLAAFIRRAWMKRLGAERRDNQVRTHGMKSGNPKYWGRNQK